MAAEGVQEKSSVLVSLSQRELDLDGGVFRALFFRCGPGIKRGELLFQGRMFIGQDVSEEGEVFDSQDFEKVSCIFENSQKVSGLLFIDRRVVENFCDNTVKGLLDRLFFCVSLDVLLVV